MVFEHLRDCRPLLRVNAINLTVQWSCRDQRRVLPELARLICNDRDPLVRSAAINATAQFFTALDQDLQLRYIQALAEAIDKDPDSCVRLDALNATDQLSTNLNPNSQFQYPSLLLPALAKAIYDFEKPQFETILDILCTNGWMTHGAFGASDAQLLAASAVINISNDYPPPDTWTPYLLEIVGTLLETHATSRLVIFHAKQELRHQKVIISDDIEWHETRISKSKILLIQFKRKLPHDTWCSIWSDLPRNHKKEFEDIWDSIFNSRSLILQIVLQTIFF